MKIYTNMSKQLKNKILQLLGGCEIVDSPEMADICVVMRNKNNDEISIINSQKMIAIAGYPDSTGESFALKAEAMKFNPDYIYFVPAGKKLDIEFLVSKINVLSTPAPLEEECDIYWEEEPEESEQNLVVAGVDFENQDESEIFWITGCRGGVGRTTIAAALCSHYLDISDKTCLLDLGMPGAAHYHFNVGEWQDKGAYLRWGSLIRPKLPFCDTGSIDELFGELKKEYAKIIVDLPAEIPPILNPYMATGKIVAIVDPDLVQTVLPIYTDPLKFGKNVDVFIYNRSRPDVPGEAVESHLNLDTEIIIVSEDFQGCMAALAANKPASEESEAIAVAVGELAARLGGGNGWSMI